MRRSKKVIALTVIALASLVVLAACGDDDNGGSASSDTTTSTSAATTTTEGTTTTTGAASATVAVASSGLGDILVDSKGMTLYIWDNDTTAGKSNCLGACADAWPPLMASGTPTYGTGLTASMFTTVTRDDGSMQLAVNGKPLYHWAADTKAGDTTGQGVNGFYVVGPNGDKITG
jgi:predicted lipoprotein with Yx(FWY)xxD motif